jgi:hypothetical protein
MSGCFLFPNNPPVATFTVARGVDNADPNDLLIVVLDASGSTDPDGDEIVSYMWTFEEDGVTKVAPQSTTMTVTESVLELKYPFEAMNSKVELVVVDARGKMSDPFSRYITVPVIE